MSRRSPTGYGTHASIEFDSDAAWTPPPSRRLSAPSHLPRFAGEEGMDSRPSPAPVQIPGAQGKVIASYSSSVFAGGFSPVGSGRFEKLPNQATEASRHHCASARWIFR